MMSVKIKVMGCIINFNSPPPPPNWRVTSTTDVRQPWTNYENNGNKHLIVGADVRSEYSNIRYLHLIIGKAQKFVSGDKYDFWG